MSRGSRIPQAIAEDYWAGANPFGEVWLPLVRKDNPSMQRNEASWDRGVRVVLGVGLLSLVFVGPQTLWGLAGLVPLATGLVGFCPLYRLVGRSTCRVQTAEETP